MVVATDVDAKGLEEALGGEAGVTTVADGGWTVC